MKIYGFQKLTLLDYPDKLAATVFTGGCNFRCPFCHNSELLDPQEPMDSEDVLRFLRRRSGVLEGVCVTGGEPTLQPDLADFLRELQEIGYDVKLDTNGYRPEVLRDLCRRGLVNYVAMDIKSSRKGYGEAAGLPALALPRIEESVSFLKEGTVPYEFRTTVVPELHSEEDFLEIGNWLAGPSAYYLQAYRDSEQVLERRFSQPSRELMERLRELLLPSVPGTCLRGID